jgi:hypothetical protein
MKKFLQKVLVFTVIVLSFATIIDVVISKGLRKTDIRMYQAWNDIYSSNISADLIVMGSSRAWAQYNTHILDSVLHLNTYNIGMDGHPFDFQRIKYETFRRYNEKPKYIIQNIDLSALNQTEDGYEREQFFPYIMDRKMISEVKKIKKINWFERHIPLLRYYGYRNFIEDGFLAYWGKQDFFDGGLYKGFRGNNYKWDRTNLDSLESVQFEVDDQTLELFEEYLETAHKEDITIILVSAPVYYEAMEKFSDRAEMEQLYQDLANRYDAVLLDYTNDSLCFDTIYFYNAMHLNTYGADIFTKKLAEDLSELLQ